MNTVTTTKPHTVEWMPLLMFSAPKEGPMVRSSMIFIGAASEPARSSRATSLASARLAMPVICTRPPVIGSLMRGAVTTSALPWSISTIAMILPLLAVVKSAKVDEPELSSARLTIGSLVCWSWLPCA